MAVKKSSKAIDVTGQRFGRLVVVGRSSRQSSAGALWVCTCDCGGEAVTTSLKLRVGHTKSCGCLNAEARRAASVTHGASKPGNRTYRSWKEMRQRCNNHNSDKWKWYGGRGIKICQRWNDFALFLADMGERPEGTSIDRINPDGDYEPSNCRWATPLQQAETNRGLIQKGSEPKNKTPVKVVLASKQAANLGLSAKTIGNQFGLSLTTVYQILKR